MDHGNFQEGGNAPLLSFLGGGGVIAPPAPPFSCLCIILIAIIAMYIIFIHSTAEVMGVLADIITDTSVRVSWERILNIPEITHYIVFYSRAGSRKRQADGEQFKTVPSTEDSVVIENLSGGARSYLFFVIASCSYGG